MSLCRHPVNCCTYTLYDDFSKYYRSYRRNLCRALKLGKLGKAKNDFVHFCHYTNWGGNTNYLSYVVDIPLLTQQLDTSLLLSTFGLVSGRR